MQSYHLTKRGLPAPRYLLGTAYRLGRSRFIWGLFREPVNEVPSNFQFQHFTLRVSLNPFNTFTCFTLRLVVVVELFTRGRSSSRAGHRLPRTEVPVTVTSIFNSFSTLRFKYFVCEDTITGVYQLVKHTARPSTSMRFLRTLTGLTGHREGRSPDSKHLIFLV